MRTTLTLDDDVDILLRDEARRSGEPYKVVVNRLIRKGFVQSKQQESGTPFVVTPFALGIGEMLDRHNGKVSSLIEELEGPFYR